MRHYWFYCPCLKKGKIKKYLFGDVELYLQNEFTEENFLEYNPIISLLLKAY